MGERKEREDGGRKKASTMLTEGQIRYFEIRKIRFILSDLISDGKINRRVR